MKRKPIDNHADDDDESKEKHDTKVTDKSTHISRNTHTHTHTLTHTHTRTQFNLKLELQTVKK